MPGPCQGESRFPGSAISVGSHMEVGTISVGQSMWPVPFSQDTSPESERERKVEEMAVLEHHNLHSDCFSQSVLPTALQGGDMTSIPQTGIPRFREARLLVCVLWWISVLLGIELRSDKCHSLHSCLLDPQCARQFPSDFRPLHLSLATHSAFSSPHLLRK